MRGRAAFAALFLVVGAAPSANAAVSVSSPPRIVDLGTLGGGDSFSTAQNELGQVVGASITADGMQHAFSWTRRGGMVDLGTLGGHSVPNAVNIAGQVTGYSFTPSGQLHGFFWSARDGMVDIGAIGGGESQALAISPFGQVVGVSTICAGCGSDASHAFSWTRAGGMVDLGTLGGASSGASAVTADGRVFGASTTVTGAVHMFSWTPATGMVDLSAVTGWEDVSPSAVNVWGQVAGAATRADSRIGFFWSQRRGFVDLGSLGGTLVFPLDINAVGQVTGYASTPTGDNHAFVWDPRGTGRLSDLGTLGGGWSWGKAMSVTGQVVGVSNPPGVNGFSHGAARHAFSWTRGAGMTDLGLIGGTLSTAVAVNASGQVAGQSTVSDNGATHAVVWYTRNSL